MAADAAEVRRLQAEVDQLKQRLDFISPMLPLLSVVQDYFDKIECEASAQIMRLKKADVVPQWPWDEKSGKAQLETTKWFHAMTEAVISGAAAPGKGEADSSNMINVPVGCKDKMDCSMPHSYGGPAGNAKLPSTTPCQSPGVLLFTQSDMGEKARSPPTPRKAGLQLPVTDHRLYGYHAQGPSQRADDCTSPRSAAARRLCTMREELQTQSGPLTTPRTGTGTETWAYHDPKRVENRDRDMHRDRAYPMIAEPMTEPSPSDGGVVLGKGSWAAACRMAEGRRAEAFQLLCTTGIVTARELSDDLTVISSEHIEECVLIAMDMLQTRPLDKWAHLPEDAKSFFQTRLAVLYEWRT